ncbi:MAG TPA: SgcJ/EcaC family oxidoreductase, partial [Thermoflexales bacterium]|nr:SgcJ/EcaC family oxidoreductase [Thermoflexales bacterium]
MNPNEQEIRRLVAHWMAASKAGDTQKVLSLMADDAVFLMPGQPPMSKAGFENAMQAQAADDAPKIDGVSDIQEIKIL